MSFSISFHPPPPRLSYYLLYNLGGRLNLLCLFELKQRPLQHLIHFFLYIFLGMSLHLKELFNQHNGIPTVDESIYVEKAEEIWLA